MYIFQFQDEVRFYWSYSGKRKRRHHKTQYPSSVIKEDFKESVRSFEVASERRKPPTAFICLIEKFAICFSNFWTIPLF